MDQKILYAGIIGPVIFIVMTLLAISNYPGYNPYVNYLSDLGADSNPGSFFISGVIISGIMGILFSLVLRQKFKNVGKTGAILLLIASIALIGVGVFHQKYETEQSHFGVFKSNFEVGHIFSATIFFLSSVAGFLLILVETKNHSLLKKHFLTRSVLCITIVLSLIFIIGQLPITEHFAVAAMNLSMMMLAVNFLKNK